tara:strand:+ start:215 stop:652 length:438 start_codon:yes stop_codon:yes gene_type:complete
MNLSELKDMTKADSVIDGTELAKESIKIPQLHNKYLNLLQDEKLILRKFSSELRILSRKKWEYYTGKMSKEEMDDLGWDAFQLNILKKDVSSYIDSDVDIIRLSDKVAYHEAKISILEETLKELNTRHWKIRNAIEWNKFTQGGF